MINASEDRLQNSHWARGPLVSLSDVHTGYELGGYAEILLPGAFPVSVEAAKYALVGGLRVALQESLLLARDPALGELRRRDLETRIQGTLRNDRGLVILEVGSAGDLNQAARGAGPLGAGAATAALL